MHWRFLAGTLLAGCCAMLAGCPAARDKATEDTAVQDTVGSSDTVVPDAVVPDTVEPSIRYLPLDAPAGMAQAVIVEGYPLVHTRQLLPLDGEGNLVAAGSATEQITQVWANLQAVLEASGSDFGKLVKLNVYADSTQTVDQFREYLSQRLDSTVRPAISAVLTPLSHAEAVIAVDAVATTRWAGDVVAARRCEQLAGDPDCADATVMPPGGVAYLSGQPEKGPLPEATARSLSTLLQIVDQLQLDRSQVVQLKAFLQPAAAADEVLREVKRLFPGQLTPPVVFVEWIASAPIEIEMIVSFPLTAGQPTQIVRYYTPPGVKASPRFSPVALVGTYRQIYISGLSARAAGDGESEVRDLFAQLGQILSKTGSDLRHLAKATYYVSDADASTMLDKLRSEFYDPQRPPAASKVTVHGVGQPDRTFTMDMIAVGSGG